MTSQNADCDGNGGGLFLMEIPPPPLPDPVLRREGPAIVWHGDALAVLRTMPANSVDSIVTDPPYGLGFMGKAWDALPPGREWAEECLRVLKPGGHMLAFGGTRTWHRLAVAIEDAGFELRDSLAWLYGSGFPKSMDVSKAIDKAAGAEREVVGTKAGRGARPRNDMRGGQYGSTPVDQIDTSQITAPATPEAEKWQGWGTALKPAFEPIVVARKPLTSTVAANVLQHSTGALNIDGCRSETRDRTDYGLSRSTRTTGDTYGAASPVADFDASKGRWPANVILDDWQAEILDGQSGTSTSRKSPPRSGAAGEGWRMTASGTEHADRGGASRFFYVAKAPTKERPRVNGIAHPTVKPLALMRWCCRLVTPPGGKVLDTFAGSGTTAEAALLEGFEVTVIEMTEEYLPLIDVRVDRALADLATTPAPTTGEEPR